MPDDDQRPEGAEERLRAALRALRERHPDLRRRADDVTADDVFAAVEREESLS
jgi:hypothetical protein